MKLRLLGLLGWLLFCFLFLVFIKLLLARSLENFFFHWDAVYWMFIDCLIGAALIVMVKRSFKLLSENSTSSSKDFLILISTIPFIAFITTVWGVVGIEKLYYGKTHTLYNWVMEYLIDLITQTMVCFSCISYFYVADLIKTKERLSEAQRAINSRSWKISPNWNKFLIPKHFSVLITVKLSISISSNASNRIFTTVSSSSCETRTSNLLPVQIARRIYENGLRIDKRRERLFYGRKLAAA